MQNTNNKAQSQLEGGNVINCIVFPSSQWANQSWYTDNQGRKKQRALGALLPRNFSEKNKVKEERKPLTEGLKEIKSQFNIQEKKKNSRSI